MIKSATLYSRLRRRGIISATAVSLFLGAVTTTNATDKSALTENFARAATWLLNPISSKPTPAKPARIYASINVAPIEIAAPIADYTDLPIIPSNQPRSLIVKAKGKRPRTILLNPHASGPTLYAATPHQVLTAMRRSADVANISFELFGSIEWFESTGGKPTAANGTSLGLCQMRLKTAIPVMKKYGREIARELASTNNPKYAQLERSLLAGKAPNLTEYNKLIFDPAFNTLLGAFDIRMVAADQGLSPRDARNTTRVYTEYLTGHGFVPGDALMGDSYSADALASNPILGGPGATKTQAFAALKATMVAWDRKMHVAYAHADMPPLPVEASQIYASAGHHPSVRTKGITRSSATAAAIPSSKHIHPPTTALSRLHHQGLPASAEAPLLPSRFTRVAGNSIVRLINTKFTLSL